MTDLQRRVEFTPAFDCIEVQPCVHGSADCRPHAPGSHGRHAVDMRFVLIGDAGAVQFVVYTGWMLNETPENGWGRVMAADLGYHSPVPRYEDQAMLTDDCEYLGNKPCYYDGSTLNAELPWRILRHEGGKALWTYLEDYYRSKFESVDEDEMKTR